MYKSGQETVENKGSAYDICALRSELMHCSRSSFLVVLGANNVAVRQMFLNERFLKKRFFFYWPNSCAHVLNALIDAHLA